MNRICKSVLSKILLCAVTACAVIPFAACADDDSAGNSGGSGGEVHSGGDAGATSSNLSFYKYKGSYTVNGIGTETSTDIVIPSTYNNLPVTSIGSSAFKDNTTITSVTIPDSITNINYNAFYGCTNLANITLPETPLNIDSNVFINTAYYSDSSNWADQLLYIGHHLIASEEGITGDYAIKEHTLTIGGGAFHAQGISSLTVPDSVLHISNSAFASCQSLTTVTIGNTSSNNSATQQASKTSTEVINDTSIGESAFDNCKVLTSVILGNNVKSIGTSAFSRCISLTDVTLNDDLTEIGDSAFSGCSKLKNITIPKSVTSIGAAAFGGTAISSFNVDANNQYFKTIDGNLYSKDETTFVEYASGKTATSFTLPSNVKTFNAEAFSNTNLTQITLQEGLTTIPDMGFNGCNKITSITIPDSVTYVGYEAFVGCTALQAVVFGSGVTEISDATFLDCRNLTSVTLGSNVTKIGSGAFEWCDALKNVTLPASLTSIGESAFNYCKSFTSITIPAAVTYIGNNAFDHCESFTSITIPAAVTYIGEGAFSNCSKLTSITFENTNGWSAETYDFSTYKTVTENISSSDLGSTSTAATYLVTTYTAYSWKRS